MVDRSDSGDPDGAADNRYRCGTMEATMTVLIPYAILFGLWIAAGFYFAEKERREHRTKR